MKRITIGSLLIVTTISSLAWAGVDTLPFDQITRGMTGTGRTTFQDTRVESFDVEILGKLRDVGPGQNLILARCSGGPLARTGILAGMSGSPVTIDGKLIGAIAYSWGFATDAIAGITPIEEMLAVAEMDSALRASTSGSQAIRTADLALLRAPGGIPDLMRSKLRRMLQVRGAALPVAVPLSLSGFGAAGLAAIQSDWTDAGFVPLLAGGSGRTPGVAPPLEPGSPIGLKLVRGDLEMAATGTVTWVDGDRVLAFGHPLFGLGAVDLPLTGANVEALLPSLRQSLRVATPLGEVGALRQDRASGVFGRLNATPRMIPVRFQLSRRTGKDDLFSFDIADDPAISPLLLYFSLNAIIANRERAFGNATVRLTRGSVIKMIDGEDIELDNLFAGPAAFDHGTGLAAYVLYLLMNNAWSTPQIAGVNLILEYDEIPMTGRIVRASLDRYRARAGETVEVTVVTHPFRGGREVLTRTIRIPHETPPGPLTLHVGGAEAINRTELTREPVLPHDLEQLIRLINQLRRNDRIYIAASRSDSGVLLGGVRLPNLPPSVVGLLSRPPSRGNFNIVAQRRVFEEVIDTDYLVEGALRLELEVERP